MPTQTLIFRCIRNCRSETINPQGTLHLKVICRTCNTSAKFEWQIHPPVDKQLLTSSRLVIGANRLDAGTNYKFHVSLKDGKGTATLQMFTPTVVERECTVYPPEGIETITEFTVNCTESTVTATALMYTLFQGGTQLLSSNNPVFTSKLNANDAIRVRIQDPYGQYTTVDITIHIEELPMFNSIDEINDIFTSKNASLDLKRMIADETQSNTLVFINAVASRLIKLQPVDVSDTVARIIGLMNELEMIHFDDTIPILHTLIKLLLPTQMNLKLAMECANLLNRISTALPNSYDDVSASDYVGNANRILTVINQMIDPFDTIPPVQNANSLISHEYHFDDYKDYGELDVGIFEKLENLATISRSVDRIHNGLATCAAKLFQPMEVLADMTAEDVQFKVLAFDREVAQTYGNHLQINGTTVAVMVSDELLAHFDHEASISCTFFDKNPMWWFQDENAINSDVVGVSIYNIGGLDKVGRTNCLCS